MALHSRSMMAGGEGKQAEECERKLDARTMVECKIITEECETEERKRAVR
jgi:hypothetical protein